MFRVQNYSEGATLSHASYANLSLSSDDDSKKLNKKELVNKNFSGAKANNFLSRYNIEYVYSNPKKGLDFTIFSNKDNGKFFMAIRGSDCVSNFIANTEIVIGKPLAKRQLLTLANQLEILKTPRFEKVKQYKKYENDTLQKLTRFMGARDDFVWNNHDVKVLDSGALFNYGLYNIDCNNDKQGLLYGKDITIVGHSIGGHLAVAAQQLLGSEDVKVLTYNAPGINIHDPLLKILRGNNPIVSSDNVINIHGKGIDVIAGFKGWYGKGCEVFTETVSHGISKLDKSLRVMSLFEQIDENCNNPMNSFELGIRLRHYNKILANTQHFHKKPLNSIIDIFNDVLNDVELKKPYKTMISVENVMAGMDNKGIEVKFVLDEIKTWDVNNVKNNPARMYALLKHSPFILSGIDYSEVIKRNNVETRYSDEEINSKIELFKAAMKIPFDNSREKAKKIKIAKENTEHTRD